MALATKRAAPPTHPTVWAGLGLSAIGLLLALYAYTGTRVYDVTFAFVAIVGGILALAGIMLAAWGRAVMSARASRARRAVITRDVLKVEEVLEERAPPTVAEPASKKRFSFPKPKLPRKADEAEAPAKAGAIFAFKRSAPPPAEAAPAPAVAASSVPVVERLTLKCPQCEAKFTAEGVRPITAVCPACAFSAVV